MEDIIADAVSNPFLTSDQKTSIISNINGIMSNFEVERKSVLKDDTNINHGAVVLSKPSKRGKPKSIEFLTVFATIASMLAVIITVLVTFIDDRSVKFFNFNLGQIFESFVASIVTAAATFILALLFVFFARGKRKR